MRLAREFGLELVINGGAQATRGGPAGRERRSVVLARLAPFNSGEEIPDSRSIQRRRARGGIVAAGCRYRCQILARTG